MDEARLQRNFAEVYEPLNRHEAHVESDRCHFCYDAPCVNAYLQSLGKWRCYAGARADCCRHEWQHLNLNYVTRAQIDQEKCISCGRCHIACEDTPYQAITDRVPDEHGNPTRHFEVIDEECGGCNLCVKVCPVEDCITLQQMAEGTDPHTNREIDADYANWTTHPNYPIVMPEVAEQ